MHNLIKNETESVGWDTTDRPSPQKATKVEQLYMELRRLSILRRRLEDLRDRVRGNGHLAEEKKESNDTKVDQTCLEVLLDEGPGDLATHQDTCNALIKEIEEAIYG